VTSKSLKTGVPGIMVTAEAKTVAIGVAVLTGVTVPVGVGVGLSVKSSKAREIW
jgi:hypothetical protein